VELKDKLDQVVSLIEGARSMPMSASCVVNRAELLGQLDELRELIPAEMKQAEFVLRDRDEVVEEGRREAERLVAAAREERLRLIAKADVMQEATREAERLLSEAREQSEQMRAEVDTYVDTKLANFEVVLSRTIAAVEKGRDKLRGRHPMDDLRAAVEADEAEPLPGG
jgi:vacuolar-type H+-ATPase subunit H